MFDFPASTDHPNVELEGIFAPKPNVILWLGGQKRVAWVPSTLTAKSTKEANGYRTQADSYHKLGPCFCLLFIPEWLVVASLSSQRQLFQGIDVHFTWEQESVDCGLWTLLPAHEGRKREREKKKRRFTYAASFLLDDKDEDEGKGKGKGKGQGQRAKDSVSNV